MLLQNITIAILGSILGVWTLVCIFILATKRLICRSLTEARLHHLENDNIQMKSAVDERPHDVADRQVVETSNIEVERERRIE